jgi:TolB-like protein/DNA-binding NarL/FixJ family response regulator
MGRLFEQLKRRNVLRAAAGYAVVAWLIIQVADTVFPILGVPIWATTMVVMLSIIGFPVTVIVSWIYQWTPAGIMTEQEADAAGYTEPIGIGRQIDFVIIVLLIIAVGWLAYDKTIVPPVLENSIAVLPFVNMSSDPEQEFFSDGMSEELLNLLAKIDGLKVIGRTSSFAFKGKNEDLRVIGQALGVKTVLEGSVRKSGDEVRITAQLIDVSDGAHIWSETYDRTMIDIFAVQDDVAAAIISALQIHVGANPTRGRPTENTEAYTLFLKARTLLNAQNGRDAIALLRRATELDPDFGEGFELLAYSYWQQGGTSISMVEAQRLLNDAASKALDINPDLALAKALHRFTGGYDQPGQTIIGALEQAWRAQPGNTVHLRPLINELTYVGYHREAHRYAEQFVDLDPLSSVAHYSLGETLFATGHATEAMAPLAFASELDNQYAKWFVPAVHLAEKHDDSAIAQTVAALARDGIVDSSWVGELVANARDPVNGQAYLDRHIPQIVASMPDEFAGEWQNALAVWYLLFGFLDRYYELIFEAGPNAGIWTDADLHVWKGTVLRQGGFTAHPKYLEVAESLGIIDVWEQRGPPDFCEKTGGEWVCE